MTYFQHNKLEDSPVFRSLTKVAQNKGWIKEEPIATVKTASKLDLEPSNDLTQNLLKLCQGLRASGFDKQAEELESKFVFYKKAQSMYGVNDEEGEDLVHAAHPKGSHKLENVDSKEATVEDILDQHIKDLEVVNKTPHGKLSNSQDILKAVKIVLAQNSVPQKKSVDLTKYTPEQLERFINNNIARVVQAIDSVGQSVKNEMSAYIDFTRKQDIIKELAQNPTIDNLHEMVSQINALKSRIKPGSWVTLGLGGITENTWATVEPKLDGAIRLVNSAITARDDINGRRRSLVEKDFEDDNIGVSENSTDGKMEVGNIDTSNQISALIGDISSLDYQLKSWLSNNSIKQNAIVTKWINDERQALESIYKKYTSLTPDQQAKSFSQMKQEIDKEIQDINSFKSSRKL